MKMSVVAVELPNSLYKRLKELAKQKGITVSQFLTTAAAEKSSALDTVEYLKREAALGTQEGFEKFLRAVPAHDPEPDDNIQ